MIGLPGHEPDSFCKRQFMRKMFTTEGIAGWAGNARAALAAARVVSAPRAVAMVLAHPLRTIAPLTARRLSPCHGKTVPRVMSSPETRSSVSSAAGQRALLAFRTSRMVADSHSMEWHKTPRDDTWRQAHLAMVDKLKVC
jgi:hypothetical protein